MINADGTGREKLANGSYSTMSVRNGFVYYADCIRGREVNGRPESVRYDIYRINIDGGKEKVYTDNVTYDDTYHSSGDIVYLEVSDGWIYYGCCYNSGFDWDYKSEFRLFAADASGNKRRIEINSIHEHVKAAGDYIYFCNSEDASRLYRVKNDNTGLQKLSDIMICDMTRCRSSDKLCVYGGWVYFSGLDGLYKVKIAGGNAKKISGDVCYNITATGDGVYYCKEFQSSGLYKLNADGTGECKIK